MNHQRPQLAQIRMPSGEPLAPFVPTANAAAGDPDSRHRVSLRLRARMRPQVRGERTFPSRLRAAWLRNSPRRGCSCRSVTVVMARSVTVVAGRCGARDVSGIPAHPASAQRFRVACPSAGWSPDTPPWTWRAPRAVPAPDRQATLPGVSDGAAGREAPVGAGWGRAFGEDGLDRVGAGAVATARPAARRQRVPIERPEIAKYGRPLNDSAALGSCISALRHSTHAV